MAKNLELAGEYRFQIGSAEDVARAAALAVDIWPVKLREVGQNSSQARTVDAFDVRLRIGRHSRWEPQDGDTPDLSVTDLGDGNFEVECDRARVNPDLLTDFNLRWNLARYLLVKAMVTSPSL